MPYRLRVLPFLAILPLLTGCNDEESPLALTGPPASRILISPRYAVMEAVGDTTRLDVRSIALTGELVFDPGYTVTSLDRGVVVASRSGSLIARGPGTTQVVVRSGGIADTASVTVVPRIASVAIETTELRMKSLGETAELRAVALDRNGNEVKGAHIAWVPLEPRVASVGPDGVVTSYANGSARVVAASAGKVDTSFIEVAQVPATVRLDPSTTILEPGETTQFRAIAVDANGNAVQDVRFTWKSSNSKVLTVDDAGFAEAIDYGTASVSASGNGGGGGSANVNVKKAPVAAVRLEPSSLSLDIGATAQLRATPVDASGTPLTGRKVEWSSSARTVASVNGGGQVKGLAAGDATISVAVEGKSATAAVAVAKLPVASVEVAPDPTAVEVGKSVTLSAKLKDKDGNELSGRSVSWKSSNTAVATVSGSGAVTGVATGSVTISATSEGKSDAATVRVEDVSGTTTPVDHVVVLPETLKLYVGETAQLNATAYDANGNELQNRSVSWASSNKAVAMISSTGMVTAMSSGSATEWGTIEGESDDAPVTVPTSTNTGSGDPGEAAFADGFEGGSRSNTAFMTWGATSDNVRVVEGIARTGQYSLEFRFPAKPDPCGDGMAEQRFRFGQGQREIWLEFWIRVPDNFVHRPRGSCDTHAADNNKLLYIGEAYHGGPIALWEYRRQSWDGDKEYSYGYFKAHNETGDAWKSAPPQAGVFAPMFTPEERGQWKRLRFHARVSTLDRSRLGVIEWWYGDKLATRLDPWDHPFDGDDIGKFVEGYLLGWSNSGFAEETRFYLDDFAIYTTDPNW